MGELRLERKRGGEGRKGVGGKQKKKIQQDKERQIGKEENKQDNKQMRKKRQGEADEGVKSDKKEEEE